MVVVVVVVVLVMVVEHSSTEGTRGMQYISIPLPIVTRFYTKTSPQAPTQLARFNLLETKIKLDYI